MSLTLTDLANYGERNQNFETEFRSRDPEGVSRPIMNHGEKRFGGYEDNLSTLLPSMDVDAWHAAQAQTAAVYSDHTSNNEDVLFQDDDPNESVLDVLTENSEVDFESKAENISDLKIDVNKAETAAEIKNDKANNYYDDAEEKMDQMSQFWDDHQAVAQEYLEMAVDNLQDQLDLPDKSSVVKQMMPSGDLGKGSAAVQVGSGGMAGAVTAVAEGATQIANQKDNLNRDQKRALIEEMVKIAQSRPALDSEKMGKVLSPGSNVDEIQENLARLSSAKMEMLVTQTVDQQPEFQALQDIKMALTDVLENHDYFANNYHKEASMDKVFALADAGNNVVVSALNDSYEVEVGASHMAFVGDHIASSGVGEPVTTQNAQIDVSSIASKLNESRLAQHMSEIKNELYAYAQNAIS